LDKPSGITSARAVTRIKRLLPKKTKVGHTGTLDPLASGLLVVLIGRSTRLSRYITALDKSYTATARFGAVSDTLDAEGEISALPNDPPMPSSSALRSALGASTGDLRQVPPMASALRVGGTRLYDLHRRGVSVERESRPVTVHSLSLTRLDASEKSATFEVSCSSGTYVRTLISDLAASLGSGAYLTSLRRTRVGHLPSVQNASRLHALEELTPKQLRNRIIPPSRVVAHLPRVEAGVEMEVAVRNGRALALSGILGGVRLESGDELLAVYRGDGEVARAEVVLCGG
jgi:tRNA pseudouridine55 synthase